MAKIENVFRFMGYCTANFDYSTDIYPTTEKVTKTTAAGMQAEPNPKIRLIFRIIIPKII